MDGSVDAAAWRGGFFIPLKAGNFANPVAILDTFSSLYEASGIGLCRNTYKTTVTATLNRWRQSSTVPSDHWASS
jgi:hypothetical protein